MALALGGLLKPWLGSRLPAEVVLGLPRATIDEACTPGGTVLVLGPDAKEELPVLFLRLRHAVLNDGVKIVELAATRTGITDGLVAESLVYRPGHALPVMRALLGSCASCLTSKCSMT